MGKGQGRGRVVSDPQTTDRGRAAVIREFTTDLPGSGRDGKGGRAGGSRIAGSRWMMQLDCTLEPEDWDRYKLIFAPIETHPMVWDNMTQDWIPQGILSIITTVMKGTVEGIIIHLDPHGREIGRITTKATYTGQKPPGVGQKPPGVIGSVKDRDQNDQEKG